MKKFNVNEHIYIKITEKGWQHLLSLVGDEYINNCINPRIVSVNGEDWHRIQCWAVFDMFPINDGKQPYFEREVMIDDEYLTDYDETKSKTIL